MKKKTHPTQCVLIKMMRGMVKPFNTTESQTDKTEDSFTLSLVIDRLFLGFNIKFHNLQRLGADIDVRFQYYEESV